MKCIIGNKMADGSVADWTCDGETSNAHGVCDSCKAAGWTADPFEVAVGIANDPELSKEIKIISPEV